MKLSATLTLLLFATLCLGQPCPVKNDFSFGRNPCSPYSATFSTTATGFNTIKWEFGDGNNALGVTNATNLYSGPGTYEVQLITQYPTCSDTVKKLITIDIQQDNQLITTIDTTYCAPTKQIKSNAGLNFCWTPTTFLDNPNSPNPTTSTPSNITYYLTSLSTGANLVPNGNFSAGNTGFTSQYIYTPNNTTAGEYFVGTNPSAWYFGHIPCTDHTTGNGNMMMVNGADVINVEVWKTTVPVTPNTNYVFSTWITSISAPNPAQLAFSINGNSLGALINASATTCSWTQFYTTWNSGSATSAVISILNKNTFFFGNDFALDDISMAPVTMKRDSVKITINCITQCPQKNDFSFTRNPCAPYNYSFSTNATGYTNIRWDFGDGNNANAVSTTTNTYANLGNYIVTLITDYPSCSDTVKKTITVDLQQDNQLITTIDTSYCGPTKQIKSNAALNFCWTPTTFLDNPNSPNPITSTPGNITYYLTSLSTGANLVPNGNFSGGNTGFTSQYVYTPNNTTEGEYFVGTNPQAWNALAPPCGDHTSGTGNMMLVNGSPTANQEIWKTTVPVTPNTNYSFSTWISPISIPNPALLAFSINGNSIGSQITTTLPTCNWTQFYTNWNSGSATTATISIINKNTIAFGNDFALDDISFSPVTMKRDSVKITINCITQCPQKNDFSFKRNPCAPFDVEFTTSATGYSTIKWDFGDGNNANAVTTTNNLYSAPGNYLVTMITEYASCKDTVKKTISIDLQYDNLVVATPDTTICFGATKKLRTQAGLNYCWTPTTWLDNPSAAEPTTSTPSNITYYLTAEVLGTNVINNGNFNAGNTGFTSQYNYATPNTTEAQYFVGPSPQAWNASLSNCADHTGSNGNMLLVNGSPAPNLRVWTQTVNVTPNTNYAFSTWIQALYPPNPAQLQFSINGNDVGSLITASLPTCNWTQFFTNWNSGSNTTATISIVNKNTQVQGNDFALDDISFAPVYMRRDSVKIIVDTPAIATNNNTPICEGASVQLNTTGANTYSWTPATGLSNANIGNPLASPTVTTQYIVTGINTNGCAAKDTVVINVSPKPVITISNDTAICRNTSVQLQASGGSTYAWTPGASLNNNSIANPVATPSGNTLYYVTVTSAANCSNIDSVQVDIVSPAQFNIGPDKETCLDSPVQLNASGGDVYNWTPSATLNNGAIPNPVANPATTTVYSVTISENKCNESATLSTTVTVLPLPSINATSSNDIDCSTPRTQLSASGGVQYAWSPTATLSNPNSVTTIAMPMATTKYFVTGTDAAGCVNMDSVTVNVSFTGVAGYFVPTGFTPNNDGKNDCFRVKDWGMIEQFEFSIYNRWGERVFFTTNSSDCWNGRHKGVEQDGGVYVYMIRAKTMCEPILFRKGTFVLIR